MLVWTLVFFVAAVAAGIFGFTNIAAAASDIARILFYLFVSFLLIALFLGALGRPERRWSR